MLLDEVTSALDPELVGEVLNSCAPASSRRAADDAESRPTRWASRGRSRGRVLLLDGGVILERGPA